MLHILIREKSLFFFSVIIIDRIGVADIATFNSISLEDPCGTSVGVKSA